jgi:hypothetical protein
MALANLDGEYAKIAGTETLLAPADTVALPATRQI